MLATYSILLYEGELLGALFAMVEVVLFLLCAIFTDTDTHHESKAESTAVSNSE